MQKNYKRVLLALLTLVVAGGSVTSITSLKSNHVKDHQNINLNPNNTPRAIEHSLPSDFLEVNGKYLRNDLRSLGLVSDLGTIYSDDSEEILEKFVSLNPKLSINELRVSKANKTKTSVFVEAIPGGDYFGVIRIKFNLETATFDNHLQFKDLGFIQNSTAEIIIDKVYELNKKFGLVKKELRIIEKTDYSAILGVRENSPIYNQNETTRIDFQIPAHKLSDDLQLPTNIIFYSLTNSKKELAYAIRRNYTNLKLDEVDITYYEDEGYFDIQTKANSQYYRYEKVAQRIPFKILQRFNLYDLQRKLTNYSLAFIDENNDDEIANYLEKLIPTYVTKNEGYIPENNSKITIGNDFTIKRDVIDGETHLLVRATSHNERLTGQAEFTLKSVKVSLNNFSKISPVSIRKANGRYDRSSTTDEEVKNEIVGKTLDFIKKEYNAVSLTNTFEDDLLNSLEVAKSDLHSLEHNGTQYYKNLEFRIKDSAARNIKNIFGSSTVKYSDIRAPKYSTDELKRRISCKNQKVLCFIDTSKDNDYAQHM
jgi:hypothetical protein